MRPGAPVNTLANEKPNTKKIQKIVV